MSETDLKPLLGRESIGVEVNKKFHPDPRQAMERGTNPVRAWRIHRRMSRGDLAHASRVNFKHLKFIESNLVFASRVQFHQLAHALEIHPAEFAVSNRAMPFSLLNLLRTGVMADDGLGRPYAHRAIQALKDEATRAAEALHKEVLRLAHRQDYYLAYKFAKGLSMLEEVGAFSGDDVSYLVADVRQAAMDRRKDTVRRQGRTNKDYWALHHKFADVANRLISDEDYDNCIELINLWSRVLGRRGTLETLALNPELYGFYANDEKHFVQGRMRNWNQMFASFNDMAGKILSIEESYRRDTREVGVANRQIGFFDAWIRTIRGKDLIDGMQNRQLIMMTLPGQIEPMGQKPRSPGQNPRFWLANQAAPR